MTLLTTLVPETCVGIAVVSGTAESFTASWGDRLEGVPMERAVIAIALRQLADALDAEAERIE